MLDPLDLTYTVVEYLRDVPELVELVGGKPEAIYAYPDMTPPVRSVEEAVGQMQTPSAMVLMNRAALGYRGQIIRWQYFFRVYFRTESVVTVNSAASGRPVTGGYYDFFTALINGVAAGQSQPFVNAQVHPDCDPPEAIAFDRVPPGGGDSRELYGVTFTLTQIGC